MATTVTVDEMLAANDGQGGADGAQMDRMTVREAWAEARRLRGVAMDMGQNIEDLGATQLRIADGCGWEDPRIELIGVEVARLGAVRQALLMRAEALLFAQVTPPTAETTAAIGGHIVPTGPASSLQMGGVTQKLGENG